MYVVLVRAVGILSRRWSFVVGRWPSTDTIRRAGRAKTPVAPYVALTTDAVLPYPLHNRRIHFVFALEWISVGIFHSQHECG